MYRTSIKTRNGLTKDGTGKLYTLNIAEVQHSPYHCLYRGGANDFKLVGALLTYS